MSEQSLEQREAGAAAASEPCYYGPCAKCGDSHGGWESCEIAWIDKWVVQLEFDDDGVQRMLYVDANDEEHEVENMPDLATAILVARGIPIPTPAVVNEWDKPLEEIRASAWAIFSRCDEEQRAYAEAEYQVIFARLTRLAKMFAEQRR